MMKSKPGPGLLALWLLGALLLASGAYASVAGRSRGPVPPVQAADSTASAAQGPAAAAPASPDTGAPAGAVLTPAAGQGPRSAAEAVRNAREQIATPFSERLISVLGMFVMLLIGWLLSVDRRVIQWRVVLWGTGLQLLFAVFILKTTVGARIFAVANDVVISLYDFTIQGASFLFGNLVWNNIPVGTGAASGNGAFTATSGMVANAGASFAFNVLPTIIFFSSLMTVLYYFGVMQAIVRGFAWVMQRTMRTSGAETLSAAGNIFMGQTEAPLLIKPFVATMTQSELMAVMSGGFATVAGGVMAAYVAMLHSRFPDIAGHLMAASVMSAPAALVFAKLMLPEKEEPVTRGQLGAVIDSPDVNVIDAAARGAGEGLSLALNVGAMLLAFIALIALINALLSSVGHATHLTAMLIAHGWLPAGGKLTLEAIFGWLLAPIAWVMGVPWKDATAIGSLLGIKTAVNEFVGYLQLSDMLTAGVNLSPRSVIIATYALCGFANFSSIAIQIGGIGGLAPSRRSDLARIGLRAMIAGTLASFMTATIAGMII